MARNHRPGSARVPRWGVPIVAACWAWIAFAGTTLLAQPVADYGDAPDDTSDPAIEAYPGVAGGFPSVFNTAHAAIIGNRGVHHPTVTQEWLAVDGVAGSSTTLEGNALVPDADADDAKVEIYCVVPPPPPPPAPPPPPICQLHLDSLHVAAGAPDQGRYLNVLVDVDRNGRWESAIPFGDFPREHLIVNRALFVPPGESRQVISSPFVMTAASVPAWVRVTVSRTPIPLSDDDFDGIPDAGWDGSISPGLFSFGETEDHLVTPVPVPELDPPKEPPSHFRVVVVPNPVPVPPGNFQVRIIRTRPPGSYTPITGYLYRLGGCLTQGVGGGINIPGPHLGGIVNDAGSLRNAPPGLVPNNCDLLGATPCIDQTINFGASYPPPQDNRITTCRVTIQVEPDGKVFEYDYPYNTEVPVRFLEPGVLDDDNDGVPDDADDCIPIGERVDPSDLEDLDGYRDDDGCQDPDNDGDGVADLDDLCPLDLEDADGFEDGDGCPDPKTVRLPFHGIAEGGDVSVFFEGAQGFCVAEIVSTPGETAASVAQRLAAAINDDPCFAMAGVFASADDGVLLVTGGELAPDAVSAATDDPGLAGARLCDVDVVPAATLLYPYFEVDLDDPTGITTFLSVSNAGPEARLAQVTLWTDWAVPTLRFPVYLTGYDIQTLDLRSLLVTGRLPATGPGASNRGGLSDPNAGFAGCNPTGEPGEPPVFANPALDAATRAHLQAWHVGAPSPMTGDCAGADHGDALARGYVTVDVVNACSLLSPADPGYFGAGGTGVAANHNALFGEYYLVRPGENFAQGEQAVHVRAAEGAYGPGDATFYGRYVGGDASDARQPLPSQFAARFLEGGVFDGTELLVWRNTADPSAAPVVCGSSPGWAPLGEQESITFDEAENALVLPAGTRFPWATQRTEVGGGELPVMFRFGRLDLDLDHGAAAPAQAWVTTLTSALGRFSVGFRAVTLESACEGAAPAVLIGPPSRRE